LPLRTRKALLVPIARNLHADATGRILGLAREIGLAGHADSLCRSRWWWRRLEGARLFSVLGGGSEIVPRLLRDVHPAVRAQAADWVSNHATPELVEMLLERISDAQSFSRFAVQDTLIRLGGLSVERLARYLGNLEDREAADALRVAHAIADPRFLAAALHYASSTTVPVRARAIALIGAVGGAGDVAVVSKHLGDANPEVRVAAARALGRMRHWPRASDIAALMRDTSWDVRRAAGLALRDLGSPGIIMLRKMTGDSNNFAADMAKQVLDLPASVAGALS
jgi:HEAT repeat protein